MIPLSTDNIATNHLNTNARRITCVNPFFPELMNGLEHIVVEASVFLQTEGRDLMTHAQNRGVTAYMTRQVYKSIIDGIETKTCNEENKAIRALLEIFERTGTILDVEAIVNELGNPLCFEYDTVLEILAQARSKKVLGEEIKKHYSGLYDKIREMYKKGVQTKADMEIIVNMILDGRDIFPCYADYRGELESLKAVREAIHAQFQPQTRKRFAEVDHMLPGRFFYADYIIIGKGQNLPNTKFMFRKLFLTLYEDIQNKYSDKIVSDEYQKKIRHQDENRKKEDEKGTVLAAYALLPLIGADPRKTGIIILDRDVLDLMKLRKYSKINYLPEDHNALLYPAKQWTRRGAV
ncbi:hypothetical protein HZA99_04145 [Candidatus Woesearchaeota archaeon]|nr:hypothetical protein [Candidatus Woesearchaeota archaeon]